MLSPPIRVWMFVAASGAAHASLGFLGIEGGTEPVVRATVSPPIEVEVTVETREVMPNPAPAPGPLPMPNRKSERPEPRPAPAPDPTPLEVPTPEAPAEEDPVPVPRPPVDLSPLAAASTVFDVRAVPTPVVGGSAKVERERGVSLDTYLRNAAGKPYLSRSDDPALRATSSGGYSFEGNGFDATIDRDGTVHFADRYAKGNFVLKPKMTDDGTPITVFYQASFDLTAWAERMAGNDPYRSERLWFLERTRALRDKLMHSAFLQVLSRADKKLRTKLVLLWRNEALPIGERAKQSFALWDELGEDEIGQVGRRKIEALLREICPDAKACALDDVSLAPLNRTRVSRAPFAPYTDKADVAP